MVLQGCDSSSFIWFQTFLLFTKPLLYWASLCHENTGVGGLRAPASYLSPFRADRREIWHAPQKLCKEKVLGVLFLKNFFKNLTLRVDPWSQKVMWLRNGRSDICKLGVKICARLKKKSHEAARLKTWRICVRGKTCWRGGGGGPPPPVQLGLMQFECIENKGVRASVRKSLKYLIFFSQMLSYPWFYLFLLLNFAEGLCCGSWEQRDECLDQLTADWVCSQVVSAIGWCSNV